MAKMDLKRFKGQLSQGVSRQPGTAAERSHLNSLHCCGGVGRRFSINPRLFNWLYRPNTPPPHTDSNAPFSAGYQNTNRPPATHARPSHATVFRLSRLDSPSRHTGQGEEGGEKRTRFRHARDAGNRAGAVVSLSSDFTFDGTLFSDMSFGTLRPADSQDTRLTSTSADKRTNLGMAWLQDEGKNHHALDAGGVNG